MWWRNVLILILLAAPCGAATLEGTGGGTLATREEDDIPMAERLAVERSIARYEASRGPDTAADEPPPAKYAFFPHAGTMWEDLFLTNFVDLDAGSAIRDWSCTDWTYNGHQGNDSLIRTFGYQDIGVPIFAALDGTVTDVHDGEFDKQVAWNGASRANYVVLNHGGTHYTMYWHMKQGSVAVSVGQNVKAGTPLGLTGSSGYSDHPHLHFESRRNGTRFEPFAGECRPGASDWEEQFSIPRHHFLGEFAITAQDITNGPFLPYDMARGGAFTRGAVSKFYFWTILHNNPNQHLWRVRFLRPNGTVLYDSGATRRNTPFYRWAWWYWWYQLTFDVSGTWTLELLINNQRMVAAPFTVAEPGVVVGNRPPRAVTTALDPPAPGPDDVVFCRVTTQGFDIDPDYDIVRYRYQWRVNGQTVRDVTTAGRADAIPRGATRGQSIQCIVTPTDGKASGPSVTASVVVSLPNDVDGNGTFNAADVVLALRMAGGVATAAPDQAARGGVAGGPPVDMRDAALLARRLAGL